ncbi:MAG: alpha-ketoacid dehydrogenase subunit beta [Rhodospirillales bacterium]|nr:alpha-ketoacid dehydrogenase subunit beta [Rhodospirillales bacterium]
MRYHGRMSYCDAIRAGFHYLLANHPEVFAIGQGLWSPWYVGNTMLGLDHEFGRDRIIDCPVSELATTGAGVGASLFGYRPIVIHPRMDFMMLASDAMVNQAAKWRHMLGGAASPAVTVRGIINRGGEQGAQHSQALHSWYAHIPGLRVVMPATPVDARDLLIQATLCNDPVLYIDDRWLYDVEDELPDIEERPLGMEQPRVLREGRDVTLVGAGHATQLCLEAAATLAVKGVRAEVVDLRVLNPFDPAPVVASVAKTGRLVAVDGGWRTCGMAGEVVAAVCEKLDPRRWRAAPRRLTLPDAPAPTSKPLEAAYYTTSGDVVSAAEEIVAAVPAE